MQRSLLKYNMNWTSNDYFCIKLLSVLSSEELQCDGDEKHREWSRRSQRVRRVAVVEITEGHHVESLNAGCKFCPLIPIDSHSSSCRPAPSVEHLGRRHWWREHSLWQWCTDQQLQHSGHTEGLSSPALPLADVLKQVKVVCVKKLSHSALGILLDKKGSPQSGNSSLRHW